MGSMKKDSNTLPPPPPPLFRTTVAEELNKGRDSVARLAEQLLLTDPTRESSAARLLLENIMEKISKAAEVLSSGNKKYDDLIAMTKSSSPDASMKDSGTKRKMQSTRKATNRKRGNPYSWKTISTAPVDGHLWRKYGQKEIFTAKYPRSYYRCTYKYDRGCMATRQVQQSQEDSSLYVITYFGEHTCEKTSTMNANTSRAIISFESNTTIGIEPDTPFSSIPFHKQESEEEIHSNLTCIDSPSAYITSKEPELQKASLGEIDSNLREQSSHLQSRITSYDLEVLDLENLFNFDYDENFQMWDD